MHIYIERERSTHTNHNNNNNNIINSTSIDERPRDPGALADHGP